ncbi:MAG: aspartate aminotransferase family protein [Rhodospirillales bacterium]|nr:aspartate aminotransferase family protein [Rhodospirillales bacterium]MBT4041287.1 aspartate aminotransferase family protein [Rhodospirillales bacterium]MBT4625322.1 aspartate aminotransferase family protein [Rhodospirillales bacterium]MBT5352521.1 aspartate aminotransferase family protein [Rhodospirillales bacterium]MBT5519501.1 aspartate aminotransferase family protein [Rhodospirillales bacterium]
MPANDAHRSDLSGPAGSYLPASGGGSDVFFGRKGTAIPLPLIERAEGIRMWDDGGTEYIDMSSGPIVSNIGHGVREVGEAIANQINTVDFACSRIARHRANIQLSDQVARLAGPGFERACFVSGGSEANEIAIKFLRQHAISNGQTNRRHVITCMPSYHGGTFSALAWSGDNTLGNFLDGMVVDSPKVPAPFTYRVPENHTVESYAQHCADALRSKINELGAENVLAFMIEPVGGVATGANVPHELFLREVRKICDENGVYLVFDEVMSGSGRTGKFLSAHYWPDIRPDVAVLAKGLAAGYVPLGAVLVPASMADPLAEDIGFDFSHTYTANPVASAAGCAVLDYTEKHGLMDNATTMGTYLRDQLEGLKASCPLIGDIRGLGLLMSLEMVADQATKKMLPLEAVAADRIRMHGLDNGLMIYSRRTCNGENGEWFMLAPPLTITRPECDELIKRLVATLNSLADELTREGLL